MDNKIKFLEEFKKLEKRIKDIANKGDEAHFSDILNIVENKNYVVKSKRQIIQNLYALRNIIAHGDRDKYLAEINNLAFEEIDKILELLNNPPTAKRVFKTVVFTANITDRTEDVIKEMNKKIYTHIPVYDNKKYVGTFSENTLLSWLVDNINQKGEADFRKSRLIDINKKYLNSPNDKIEFISQDTNIFDIKQIFEKTIKDKKRLGALYITSSGNRDSFPPIGIVTAYDLPRIDEYLK
jgi:predicted transcriptional regulator